jgi:acetyl-CoA carboxylase biotin carboxyl carrier protein
VSDPILDAIDRLAPAFAASDLDALEVEADELLVRLARPQQAPVSVPALVASPPAPTAAPPSPGVPPADAPWGAPAAGRRFVSAPLTGIWYAAPSPGARAYVEPGSEVAAGAVIGLIEAMKLFNEIKTDVAGTVTRVMAESGQLVKRQQPLLEIDPS